MKIEHRRKIKKWKILRSAVAYKNPWWDIREETVLLPGGRRDQFYVNHSAGGVFVFPLTRDKRVILVRQYKHGARRIVLELPIGRVEKSDKSLSRAEARELLEETGFKPKKMRLLGSFAAFPTSSTTKFWIYLAEDCQQISEPEDSDKEISEVLSVSLPELRRLLRSGKIISIIQAGAIYFVLDKMREL